MRPTALCAALRLKAAKRRRLRITDTLLYSLDYDRDGIIDEYVVRYLSALRDAGADICFITSTAAPKELEKIRQFVFRIIIKNDAGRDFGSWYLALESIQQVSGNDTRMCFSSMTAYISPSSIAAECLLKWLHRNWTCGA